MVTLVLKSVHKRWSIKCLHSDFKSPSPLHVRAHTLLACIPPLSTSIRLLFLKKIKETTVQGYLNQNTKKSPGIEGAFLTIRGSWEWITLAVWIAHFIYFVSILYRTHEKTLWCTLTAEHPPFLSPIQFSTFLAGPPIPLRAYLLYGWLLSSYLHSTCAALSFSCWVMSVWNT